MQINLQEISSHVIVFQYYRSEYNRYQEENATDENVLRFGDVQGVSDLPTFDSETNPDVNPSPVDSHGTNDVTFRPSTTNEYYPTASEGTTHTYLSQSDRDDSQYRNDSYLVPTTTNNRKQAPRTIAGNVRDETVPLVPLVGIKPRAPLKPSVLPSSSTGRDNSNDSYV